MKAEFDFDGDRLRLFIRVEGRCEVAIAKVIEKYNRATVSLSYPDRGMYSYTREEDPRGIEIVLREAPKCQTTGTWCANGCDGMAGCILAAQEASQSAAVGKET
jgi:hypothetical protein